MYTNPFLDPSFQYSINHVVRRRARRTEVSLLFFFLNDVNLFTESFAHLQAVSLSDGWWVSCCLSCVPFYMPCTALCGLCSQLCVRYLSAQLRQVILCILSSASQIILILKWRKRGETSRTARSNLEGWQAKQSTFQIIQDDGRLIFFLHLND